VIAVPALLVSRLREQFPGAVEQPSSGSLGFPWRLVLIFVGIWAILMGLIALISLS
jgi:hypothetical protein